MATTTYPPLPPGMKLIFRKWKTDPKTGKRVYAKKVFPMLVPDDGRN